MGATLQADAVKDRVLQPGGMTIWPPDASGPAHPVGGGGYRIWLTNGVARVPLLVVGGTPYQMGWHLGRLLREEIQRFIPAALAAFSREAGLTEDQLDRTWATTAAYTDDRVEQELIGMAEGADISARTLQRIHCLPLLMPYSCSSIAAWGKATADGHLYQTRNLDWSLEVKAHEFPALVLYLPTKGWPHAQPSFAGFVGAHCGMNAAGLVLAEMGDSPQREAPYNLHAPHFTTWFRSLLYDADGLTEALQTFRSLPHTKRYHYVFGDGRVEKRAVKIRAHTPEPLSGWLRIWGDQDATDELAPNVLPGIVYQDEGRGAFPILKASHGRLDAEQLVALCNQIPIRGGNVVNVVFDATAFRLWVSYAGGESEAYQRPYVFADLSATDGDRDGIADVREGALDLDADGRPDFLDADPVP